MPSKPHRHRWRIPTIREEQSFGPGFLCEDAFCGEALDSEDANRLQATAYQAEALLKVVGDEGVCRDCLAPIYWVVTKASRRAPYNPDASSHFATCPKADEFRRRR